MRSPTRAAAASFAMAGTASSSGVVAVCASAANASHSAADARASGDVAAAADAHTPGDTSLDVASGELSLAGFWRGGFVCFVFCLLLFVVVFVVGGGLVVGVGVFV